MTADAIAQSEIDDFQDQFGEPHLALAYQAAFPLVLNPDLLYRLWANFQRDVHGGLLGIPWVAVADLLLSSLCEEIAYETYRMPDPMRNLLLECLHEDERFRSNGQDRLHELGEFVRQYVQNDLASPRQSVREVAEAQRWAADAYTRPEALVQSITETYGALQPTDRPEHLRLAALLQTFNAPLTGWAKPDEATSERFGVLVMYSQGMASLVRGNEAEAKEHLGQVAGKVDLPLPAGIVSKPEEKPAPRSRRDKLKAIQSPKTAQPQGWETIVDRIRQGRCVPILGGWLDFEVAVGVSEEDVTSAYANLIEYPLPAPYRLEQMIEYRRAVMGFNPLDASKDFFDFLKGGITAVAESAGIDRELLTETREMSHELSFTEFANRLGYPTFGKGEEDPLLLLANLPLPIYVTTSYFSFLENALTRAGKKPRSESYRPEANRFRPAESQSDLVYEPSVSEPMVYHVFGVDRDPRTLVLSEDDYLGYVMKVAEFPDRIPPVVRSSLALSSLLSLGHDPDTLRWRVLDHTILQGRPGQLRPASVFQLLLYGQTDERALIDAHLKRSNLTAFWGPPDELLSNIWKGLRRL